MSRLLIVSIAFVVMFISSEAFLAGPTTMRSSLVKISTINRFQRSSLIVVRQSDTSDGDIAAEKERKLLAAKAAYEEKMLAGAMQVTKNQEAFFSIGKFLIPVVVGVWIYTIATGGVLDVGMSSN